MNTGDGSGARRGPPGGDGEPIVDGGNPIVDGGEPIVDGGEPIVDGGETVADGGEAVAASDGFRFAYSPPAIRFGTGAAGDLDAELAEGGFERGLVVCGETVGSTPAVIDPVTDGLGDRLAGVFDGTTPEKRLSTAYEALRAAREWDADVLVALGGGSSLDVATVASALSAVETGDGVSRSEPAAVGRELAERGTFSIPEGDLLPIVAVPTTLAGAELSQVAGVTAAPEAGPIEVEDVPDGAEDVPDEADGVPDEADGAAGGISDPRLMPRAVVADPALFATTPRSILAASAMNGFDKAIETPYARNATPFTDGTAVRALRLLADGLPRLGREPPDADVLEPVVKGICCAQYGVSRPDGTTLSIVHAFGHGLTRTYEVQQGAAHAVVVPHVLEYVFGEVRGGRELLAEGLGVAAADDRAAAIVDRVTEIRDALGLPSRLRDVDGPAPEAFPTVAEHVLTDSFMANAPAGLEPTADELEDVLRASY